MARASRTLETREGRAPKEDDVMRTQIVTWLGVLALAAPAAAQNSTGTVTADESASTYTPGRSGSARDVELYSQRGSAVRGRNADAQHARGGGPGTVVSDAHRASDVHVTRGASRHASGLHSDNQTRRPGAANYTGSSGASAAYRSDGRHTLPTEPGVPMQGDTFSTARTASPNRGRIDARPPSSNEATRAPAPSARGGGPVAHASRAGRVVLPTGRVETLAVSRPLHYDPGALPPAIDPSLPDPADREVTASLQSLPDLNENKDGVGNASPGLLATDPTLHPTDLLGASGVASTTPAVLNARLGYPALSRAIGGGPSVWRAPFGTSVSVHEGR